MAVPLQSSTRPIDDEARHNGGRTRMARDRATHDESFAGEEARQRIKHFARMPGWAGDRDQPARKREQPLGLEPAPDILQGRTHESKDSERGISSHLGRCDSIDAPKATRKAV